ncbi:MAG: hypothetical protein HY791_31150 [Deltaproteobacteria bacterium]|nr:hypothetical protein [Deltaproteobacteria bacterium]
MSRVSEFLVARRDSSRSLYFSKELFHQRDPGPGRMRSAERGLPLPLPSPSPSPSPKLMIYPAIFTNIDTIRYSRVLPRMNCDSSTSLSGDGDGDGNGDGNGNGNGNDSNASPALSIFYGTG